MIAVTRILCPVDFSPPSRQALRSAVQLARWYDAEVTVTHVVQIALPPAPFRSVPALTLTDIERDDAHAHLRRLVGHVETSGVRVSSEVLEGVPVEAILRRARDLGADLIVLGTHGRSGFEHLLLGSVAERVLRKAACPVITVRSEGDGVPISPAAPFGTILAAVDFSPASAHALDHALLLAQESGGRLIVLHAPDWPASVSAVEVLGSRAADYQARLLQESRLRLRAAVPPEARTWCEIEERVVFGRSWEVIVNQAERLKADLIVIGAHGRHGLLEHVIGSTTDHVVRRALCPVLTVREAEPAADDARHAAAGG